MPAPKGIQRRYYLSIPIGLTIGLSIWLWSKIDKLYHNKRRAQCETNTTI